MRGGPAPIARSGRPQMPANEATSRPYEHPAPYDGWNARGNLANMKSTEALQMDNVFPGVQNVSLRLGCVDWKTGAALNVHSLLPYTGLTTNKLFAATSGGIYDVTAAGAWPGLSQACTNGYWFSLMTSTSGGNFMFCVNGVDAAVVYDGAAWSTPAITVATSSTWNYVTLHKRRIWAIQKNTTDLWYLGTDSIAGAATKFPVGALFKRGGYLVALGSWTLDGGNGLDDYLVIITSNGELAVYQGTDPGSASTWALVGVFDVPKPVGSRPLIDYGGDLLYLNTFGLLQVSTVVQSAIVDRTKTISSNIDGAFLDAVVAYKANLGWQLLLHKSTNFLLVNVPVTTDGTAYQFVMNTTTKAWCRFTGWNAACWCEFNGDIYFGGGTKVSKAWFGTTDAGAPITGSIAQAYARFGNQYQSKVELARPNFGFTGAAQIQIAIDTDFKTFNGQTSFTYTPSSAGAIWDTGLWDTGTWDAGISLWEPKWTTVPGDIGYLHSFRLQVIASSGNFIWTSTNFALRSAGILG